MSIPSTCDIHDHFSVRPETRQIPYRQMQQLLESHSSESTRYTIRIHRATFVEDFTLEHTISGLRLTSIEITSIF